MRVNIGLCIFAFLFGHAGVAMAQSSANVIRSEQAVSELIQKCNEAERGSEEQLECFDQLSKAVKGESTEEPTDAGAVITQALGALREIAQYQDDDSGLSITGDSCNIRILYYNNHYRVSRRNISVIDLFSASFDASNMSIDQTTQIKGDGYSWLKGTMKSGTTAVSQGGMALESNRLKFEPKSPKISLADYAAATAVQLPAQEGETFEFALIHPKRNNVGREIWQSFKNYVQACNS